MVRRWMKYLGREEAIKLMMWNNSDPSFSLRFQLKLISLSFLFFIINLNGHVIISYKLLLAYYRANRGKGFTRAQLVSRLETLKVPLYFHKCHLFYIHVVLVKQIFSTKCTEFVKLQVPYELSPHLDDFVRIQTGMQVCSCKNNLCLINENLCRNEICLCDFCACDRVLYKMDY